MNPFNLLRSATFGFALTIMVLTYALFPLGRTFFLTPFREAQTAISVRSLEREAGWAGDYSTPVLGQPWRIPFEFGFFQEVVARGTPKAIPEVDRGRWVSVFFAALCAWCVYRLALEAGWEPRRALWLAALFASAPVIAAYGAAYLIESTALFWALLYVWLGWRGLRTGRWSWLGGAGLAGVLAALVKSTTWVPAAAALFLLGVVELHARRAGPGATRVRGAATLAALLAIPLAAAFAWVAHTDAIKSLNPLGEILTSANLASWNYGTLAQKLSPAVWGMIAVKSLFFSLGPLGLLAPVVLAGALWRAIRSRDVRALWIGGALVAFLSAPLVFTNLYFRHNYYLYANAVFLVVAVAVAGDVLQRLRVVRAWLFLLPVSAAAGTLLFLHFQRALVEPAEDRVVQALRVLPAPGPVAFIGFTWSARMPFEADRKGMFLTTVAGDARDFAALEANRGGHYSAVVWQGPRELPFAARAVATLLPDGAEAEELWPGVWIAGAPEGMAALRVWKQGRTAENVLLSRVRSRLTGAVAHGPFVYWQLDHRAGRESRLAFAIRRNRDLFYFESGPWKLWRLNGYFEP